MPTWNLQHGDREMSKPLIIIADTDEKYLSTLESKFLSELDDSVELEVISKKEYFETYFSTPRTVEIAAIGESMYSRDLHRHNISNLFVLTEEEGGNTEELSITHIYKYTGIKEIYNELVYQSAKKLSADENAIKDTEVIAFYSAIGGTGKTSLSIGLARCLAKKHKKVLYLNTESIQEFGFYLEDKSGMPSNGYRAIKDDKNHIYHNIRPFIRKELFSYIPPFLTTLDARNLDFSIYGRLIKDAKESKKYDFIIVDIEAGYSHGKVNLLQEASRVLLITKQDPVATFKMEFLTKSLDFGDREKYMVICNNYDSTKENVYFRSEMQSQFPIKEYVEYATTPLESADQLARLGGIEKLSYMFI